MTRPSRPPLRVAADPADADLPGVRQSLRVATVARALDMDQRDVRRLVTAGELDGHGKGKRGVRIYADSVAAYQAQRPLAHRQDVDDSSADGRGRAAPTTPRTPEYREALASLAKHGL